MQQVIFILFLLFIGYILYNIFKKKKPLATPDFDVERKILQKYVVFYRQLNDTQKIEFEERVQNFLTKVRITGIDTEINDEDRIFVAAAAIIPIFGFKGWEYRNIHEVLIYPHSFNKSYETEGPGRDALGVVGDGPLKNTMILSKTDLENGFINTQGKSNTAIHEFVHLIDKEDGCTDGIPESLLPHKYALPWLKRIHQETEEIKKGKSDINPYAATNEAEFLAVVSEYFFTQPHLMEKKHLELFDLLEQIFKTPLNR